MGTDRYMEERDACPSRLAAANAKIVELLRELTETRRQRDVAEDTLRDVMKQRDELRFAQAADRERVIDFVKEAIDRSRDLPIGRAERAIANRVAEQLATTGARLSETDRAEIDGLLEYLAEQRGEAFSDSRSGDAGAFHDWRGAVLRLLGATK